MHVIAWLIDLARYRDRALMFQAAAEQVGRMTLVCATPPPADLPRSSAVDIVPLADGPIRRQRLQYRFLRWLKTAPPAAILHDTQGFMLPAFARARPGTMRLSSNFASTWDWARNLRGRWPVEWPERELRYHMQWAGEFALARVTDAFTVFGPGHRTLFGETYRVPFERVHSLPNCIDPAAFPLRKAPRSSRPTLLFVGSVFRYKGIYELLAATRWLRTRWPDLHLRIVGGVPPKSKVRAEIARLDLGASVELLGPRPRAELATEMATAHAIVLPSYTEGSPRVLIEAMASGCPIVATDIAGIQALDPDGQALHLVPRFEVQPLAHALDRVLRDPEDATRRAELARQRFEQVHTPTAASRALAELYQELAR
jgi:glycosyltransferase involved in cell wall biosynthesis